MKLRATNGLGLVQDFDLPEDNLWLSVVDERGSEHHAGSLYVTRDVFGAVSIELGTADNVGQTWEGTNPVRLFNESLHTQYQTPDRGRNAH